MLLEKVDAVSARKQYDEFRRDRKPCEKGELLVFEGVDGFDVYNPSIPFNIDGMTVIAGRVERRDTEKSKTMFFAEKGDKWVLIEEAPVFELQDPFITWIGGELVVGGVNVQWGEDAFVSYHTDFYKGNSLFGLKHFLSGPPHMKDIRLIELKDGRIGVFSRPQGQKMQEKHGCIAKIGFTLVNSLDELTMGVIENAPHLEGHFLADEWGGCNQLYELKNGLIGVIGHKSWGEYIDGVLHLHYYSMAFAIDPESRKMTQVKIICSRDCFPEGPYKNIRLKDVTFTSGIIRLGGGKAMLYSGLSDCQAGRILIDDPFDEYEKL